VVIGLSQRGMVVLAWEEDSVVECHSDRRRANLFPQVLLVHQDFIFGVDIFGFSVKWLSLACGVRKTGDDDSYQLLLYHTPVHSTVDLVGISVFYQWTSRKILTEIRE